MIITKTPYRISFFGGGTDYPGWFKENGGQVLSTTIDKYNYISCRYLPPFFEHKMRLVYSMMEECNDSSELDHPSAREVLKFLEIPNEVEIHYDGDLPGRSGTGSSSSFTVGLLKTLYAYKGISTNAKKLAEESIHIEQNLIGETVGSQDQVAAAYGGFNHILFNADGSFEVNNINIDESRLMHLDSRLMLFFTGISRYAEKVAKTYVENIVDKSKQLNLMHQMVNDGIKIITKGEIDDFGFLLNEAWQKKKELSTKVSSIEINEIYDKAINAGALGGKISGAGGGGFMYFYVPIEKQDALKKSLSNLIHVPFSFEDEGSQIIFDENNGT
jgi:D-glycero-alpha-D-manno-heptose-7-phosphate kinase